MTTLVIQNKGLVDPYDLTLIGSSTKRGDDTKIGMFGSGWKYALAWLLRNNIAIRIFSGEKEIKIDHEIVLHRNKPTRVLTVDGERTSITAEMGPQWTGWMAIREMVSNAIDEGEHMVTSMLSSPETTKGYENKTTIYIPLNHELTEVVKFYSHYFAFDRPASATTSYGKVFVKPKKDAINFYRKGIKCFDTDSITRESDEKYFSRLDFDFDSVQINESRVAVWNDLTIKRSNFIHEGVPKDILLIAIQEKILPYSPSNDNIERMKELIEDGKKFISKTEKSFAGILNIDANAIELPDIWAKKLLKIGVLKTYMSVHEGLQYIETDKINCQEIMYHLRGVNIDTEVICGQYADTKPDVLAITSNKMILRDSLSAYSTKYLAARIVYNLSINKLEDLFV